MSFHVLILGGTTQARALAEALAEPPEGAGLRVTTSLAGRVDRPVVPPGALRVGGFGGVDGLAGWLCEHDVDALVDATHPFADRISANAVAAAARTGTPLLVLTRPAWEPVDGDDWRYVDTVEQAAELVHDVGERALITTGRQSAPLFLTAARARRTAGRPAAALVIRCVQAPDTPPDPPDQLILDRGPFTLGGERNLLRDRQIDVLVTKNSGGPAAAPKLAAARELGLPVVVVDRPGAVTGPATGANTGACAGPDTRPATAAEPRAETVEAALVWLRQAGAGRLRA